MTHFSEGEGGFCFPVKLNNVMAELGPRGEAPVPTLSTALQPLPFLCEGHARDTLGGNSREAERDGQDKR